MTVTEGGAGQGNVVVNEWIRRKEGREGHGLMVLCP